MHVALVNFGIMEDFFDRFEGAVEKVLAELFKVGTGDGCIKVDTLIQGIDLNRGLGGSRRVCLACSQAVQRQWTAWVLEEISGENE